MSAELRPSASRQKISNSRVERLVSGVSLSAHLAEREPLGDLGVEMAAAGGDLLHRRDHHPRRAALREVAARAGRERLLHEHRVLVHAEDEDARVRVAQHDAPDRLEAADAGQRQVHDDDVGRELRERWHAASPVSASATTSISRRVLQQQPVARAYDRVIVDEQHANTPQLAFISSRSRDRQS